MKPYLLTRANVDSELIRPMFGPFGRLDRADAAVVRRVHVAHLEARALAGEAARPERRDAALVGHFDSGLVWSMNWLSCDEPKNSRTAATAAWR
jgi:hypothetical protein